MATRKQTAARRRNIKKAQKARRKPRRRAAAAAANPRRKRRKAAASAAANPRRKRRRAAAAANPRKRRRKAAASAAANPRRKRRRKAAASAAANPRRKRRRSQASANSWYGQPVRHRKAVKKGLRRKAVKKGQRRKAARRRGYRANPATPATNINVSASAPANNPWYGQPGRHRKAAKKGWARKRRGKAKARGKKRCPPCRPRRGPGGKFAGGFSRRELAENPQLANPQGLARNPNDNPYTPALYDNPFDTKSVVSYGAAAVTVTLGLIAADFVDRAMATRKPAKGPTGAEAKRAWYGRDAAAAQRMRPDAWRLGAQAAGAVISLALAYFTRNIKVVPWLLGGFGIGFGANLLKKLSDWWIMPAILKVKEGEEGKETWANRLFPMEQASIQNEVVKMFQNWDAVESLKNQQQETALIQSPLGNTTTGPAYQLGKAQGDGAPASAVGSPNERRFMNTGRLGLCPECHGQNGCYSDCGTLCPNCPEYNPRTDCECTVEEGDDLAAIAAAGGVSMRDVDILNGGTPATYWRIGNKVKLPYGACCALERRGAPVPAAQPEPAPSAPVGPFAAPIPQNMIPQPPRVEGVPEPVLARPASVSVFDLSGNAETQEDE